MAQELEDIITKERRRRLRLRSIYIKLRKQRSYEGLSDIALLSWIIEILIKLKLPYSVKEVYSAFKRVSKEDYSPRDKRAILRQFKREAKQLSVF